MSVFDKIFGRVQQAPNPQAAVINPSNDPNKIQPQMTTAQTSQTAPNGVVPEGGANPPEQKSPLEEHAKLWEPTTVDDKNKQEQETITPEKMMEAASKVDFTKVLTPEELTKVQAGGEEAQKILINVINKVSQAAYGQSAVVAKKLVDSAVEKEREAFLSSLPSLIKKHAVTDPAEDPALQNPAIAPVVAAIKTQLLEKYPKADKAWINKQVGELMKGAAEMYVPQQKNSDAAKAEDQIDWDEWIKQS